MRPRGGLPQAGGRLRGERQLLPGELPGDGLGGRSAGLRHGQDYDNEDIAELAGSSVAFVGPCALDGVSCSALEALFSLSQWEGGSGVCSQDSSCRAKTVVDACGCHYPLSPQTKGVYADPADDRRRAHRALRLHRKRSELRHVRRPTRLQRPGAIQRHPLTNTQHPRRYFENCWPVAFSVAEKLCSSQIDPTTPLKAETSVWMRIAGTPKPSAV